MGPRRLNLPNAITGVRILACPVIFILILSPRTGYLTAAFVLFVAASLSDLWDGYLARKHGWITDTGKLLDPIADKLLLIATFIPFYMVSQGPDTASHVPWWGPLPLWVLIVVLGREVLVTALRMWAAQRGSVISAGPSGKIKAFVQNIFSGGLILWFVLVRMAAERGWEGTTAWSLWEPFHAFVVAVALGLAVVLTVYSLGVYLWQNRRLLGGGAATSA